jgi:hypothetical protein
MKAAEGAVKLAEQAARMGQNQWAEELRQKSRSDGRKGELRIEADKAWKQKVLREFKKAVTKMDELKHLVRGHQASAQHVSSHLMRPKHRVKYSPY